jgi:hypothetical protein
MELPGALLFVLEPTDAKTLVVAFLAGRSSGGLTGAGPGRSPVSPAIGHPCWPDWNCSTERRARKHPPAAIYQRGPAAGGGRGQRRQLRFMRQRVSQGREADLRLAGRCSIHISLLAVASRHLAFYGKAPVQFLSLARLRKSLDLFTPWCILNTVRRPPVFPNRRFFKER